MTGPASAMLDELRAALRPHGLFLRGVVDVGEERDPPAGRGVETGAIFPSPPRGEGGPKGRMRGPAASEHQEIPPHPPFGHLLPAGEKGGASGLSRGDGPNLKGGGRARSVVLIGNIGGSLWRSFSAWREGQPDMADPLDTWSKAVLRPLAERFGATAYFPSDPPWQPFQRWAMQADGLKPSPLGILIHPVYGLWHGYRGAFSFRDSLPVSVPETTAHPCESCLEKPCLTHCPAGAITLEGFQYQPCRAHLRTSVGEAGCMQAGCLARAACPVGVEYQYTPEQLRFHMAALER